MMPHMVHITLGDCHIYKQHIEHVKEQISRQHYILPTLTFPDFKTIEEVEQSKYTDYILHNYNCNPAIKTEMIA
jgi:thymidylate synthase